MLNGFFIFYFSFMTRTTPETISSPDPEGSSDRLSQQQPAEQCPGKRLKEENRPPLAAFSNCNPRFQSMNAQAVEITPKYKSPPHISVGQAETKESPEAVRCKRVRMTNATQMEYVVTTSGE